MKLRVPDAIRRLFYKIQDLRPSPLPVGLTAFDSWCDRLLFTYFPDQAHLPDQASFRFSVAAMVLHLDAQKAFVSNRYFGRAIAKGAANQVASYVMHQLKAERELLIQQQEAAAKAEAEKKLADATALPQEVAASGQPQQSGV